MNQSWVTNIALIIKSVTIKYRLRTQTKHSDKAINEKMLG